MTRKPEGYLRIGKRYISHPFLLTVLLGFLALLTLYATVLHPVVILAWYQLQAMPTFRLDSPYLAAYEGNARLVLLSGSLIYEGSLKEAAANGRGKLYDDNILIYEGDFVQNMYQGKGKLYNQDGFLLYEGDFIQNLYHGEGKLYNPDGYLLYDGEFVQNLYNGEGKLYNPNGSLLYAGGFELNQDRKSVV